ncbi:uncharacterized protein LOC118351885 [Canis lupus dingo]|uniref:uncharacterized protein LOC118351885 n=1 Tax=Canis lupus dingo TaxID=286419 RepID=UPI0015F1344A|nr:uncharacterized protein LOC118351885 [Canis lupus dingo]
MELEPESANLPLKAGGSSRRLSEDWGRWFPEAACRYTGPDPQDVLHPRRPLSRRFGSSDTGPSLCVGTSPAREEGTPPAYFLATHAPALLPLPGGSSRSRCRSAQELGLGARGWEDGRPAYTRLILPSTRPAGARPGPRSSLFQLNRGLPPPRWSCNWSENNKCALCWASPKPIFYFGKVVHKPFPLAFPVSSSARQLPSRHTDTRWCQPPRARSPGSRACQRRRRALLGAGCVPGTKNPR